MDETIRLIKMAHEGDKEARETLVLDNVGLVLSLIHILWRRRSPALKRRRSAWKAS